MLMLHTVMRSSMFIRSITASAVFVSEPFAASHSEPANDVKNDVLGINADTERAVDIDPAHFEFVHRQCLRRQHVAHLARADAEGEGAERAVSARMAVAACQRHPRLGQAELRPDDVHDPLVHAVQAEKLDAELLDVSLQRLGKLFRFLSRNGLWRRSVGTM